MEPPGLLADRQGLGPGALQILRAKGLKVPLIRQQIASPPLKETLIAPI